MDLAWFFYYGYIYNYSYGKGDYLSGIRYMIPIMLGTVLGRGLCVSGGHRPNT